MQDSQIVLHYVLMNSDKLKVFVPALLLMAVGFLLAYQFVDPAPPSKLTFSAGSKEGMYYAYAKRYQAYLQQQGVQVEVLESAGSLENVQRLQTGGADVAFVQSGITAPDDQRIESLGSMYYEPLWVFIRKGEQVTTLNALAGKIIAIGVEGSGTRVLAQQLLGENGVSADNSTLSDLGGSAAAQALLSGEVDALFLVADIEADIVKQLNGHDAVALMNVSRAAAYTRRIATLSELSLPRGVLDLKADRPKADIHLLAATATLQVNKSLHPALQDLLMQAAYEIHGGRNLLSTAGEFPTPNYTSVELSQAASRFYQSGPSFLQRYLPFWAATLVDRLKVMLLPFIALLLPLIKVMPPIYRWRVRSRIYRWYDELNRIDTALGKGSEASLLDDLGRIEAEIRKVHVPLSYADELYNLRMHLALIRESVLNQHSSD